jgi:hypothetical protein
VNQEAIDLEKLQEFTEQKVEEFGDLKRNLILNLLDFLEKEELSCVEQKGVLRLIFNLIQENEDVISLFFEKNNGCFYQQKSQKSKSFTVL